jgi:hypothetical protein
VSAVVLTFQSPKPAICETRVWAEDLHYVEGLCIYAEAIATAVKSGPLSAVDRAILQGFRELLEATESQT